MRIGSWRPWCSALLLSIPTLHYAWCSAADNTPNPLRSAPFPEVPGAVPHLDSQRKQQPQQQQQQHQLGGEEGEGPVGRISCASVDMDGEKSPVAVGTASPEKAPRDCPAGTDQDTAADSASSGSSDGGGGTGSSLADDDYVPERYVVGCGGDRVEAARRYKETLAWRKEHKVDDILETPQPRFHDCREVFPVFLHGRSRKGHPVLWERIGKVNVGKADELNLPLTALTTNYVFFNECIWRLVLDKGENDSDYAQFITVEDVGGVRPWHATPRVLSVLRSLTGVMKAHYIERCYKSYIINAPRAFTALWRIVSPMLDPRTRAKISILGTDYLEAMQEEIDISQIPPDYGGSSGRELDDSDDERKLQALLARLNSETQAADSTPANTS